MFIILQSGLFHLCEYQILLLWLISHWLRNTAFQIVWYFQWVSAWIEMFYPSVNGCNGYKTVSIKWHQFLKNAFSFNIHLMISRASAGITILHINDTILNGWTTYCFSFVYSLCLIDILIPLLTYSLELNKLHGWKM